MSELEQIVADAQKDGWFFNLQRVSVKRWGGWKWVATFARPHEVMTRNHNARNDDMLTAVKEADGLRKADK